MLPPVVPLEVPVDDPAELPAELAVALLEAAGWPVELPVELPTALAVEPAAVEEPTEVPLETWVWSRQPVRLAASKPEMPTNARDAADPTKQNYRPARRTVNRGEMLPAAIDKSC